MNNGIRKAGTCLLAALLLLTIILPTFGGAIIAHADGGAVVRVHYNRPDGKYDGWSVWMWPKGGDGADYPFEEVDGEMVATMEAPAGTTEIGYIVRTKDWGKDVDKDQFVDIAEVISGSVDLYIESGVEGCTKKYGEDAVLGTKLKTAVYRGDAKVEATFTGELSDDQAKTLFVEDKEGEIAVTDIAPADEEFVYLLTLEKELQEMKEYSIFFEDTKYKLIMPIIYSTEDFEKKYTYEGDDLGLTVGDELTFKLWAPMAEKVMVNFYESGSDWKKDRIESREMTAEEKGVFTLTAEKDLLGKYYTYTVTRDGKGTEVVDPYARTTGFNGMRAMILDLSTTNPEGWEDDKNPHADENITDAVIYEVHVRDLSADENSGIENKGKFLGFTETGTKTPEGNATGLDHIKELGATHVHVLPMYDYGAIDETISYAYAYNWGYDPVNYNVPEGSYATDAANGEVRVKELKEMVKTLHENGISVVMDVVYNHVYNASEFCINKILPGYFSRISDTGTYSNGSGCGNDTASERSMVRKYIVDSVVYWANEYHLDGFRFDLVGLLDTETVNEIVEEVHKTRPDVIFYGEGWSMATDVTKDGVKLATQQNSKRTPSFAYFNDNLRDGVKGNVFDSAATGYVSGLKNAALGIKNSWQAQEIWSENPSQIIQYVSCHDNLTLFDKLAISREDASEDDRIRMNNLAAAIYLTAQGVPFLMSGEEMLRSKVKEDGTFDENSYASPDSVNALKWSALADPKVAKTFEYYKGLIAFRKAHPSLRLTTPEEVSANVSAIGDLPENVLAFNVAQATGDLAEEIFVVFNPNPEEAKVKLPDGKWNVYVDADKAGTEALYTAEGSELAVAPISAMVLVKEDKPVVKTESKTESKAESTVSSTAATESKTESAVSTPEKSSGSGTKVAVFAGVIAAALLGIFIMLRANKKNK